MKKLQALLISVFLVTFALTAVAQVENGQFAGIVTDPSGAAIANAKVTVINVGTNVTLGAVTSSSGAYNVSQLPIGKYTVTVEAKGFRKSIRTDVTANAGVLTHLDFKMELGQATETVEVSGEAPPIQTDDSRLSEELAA